MHYDLTDLRVFLAVAQEANLSRAAARCHLSPSSVSLRLKGLEDEVGAPLFVRQARGVSLTPAGSVMLVHVKRCFAQLAEMHADLLPFAEGTRGHITLFALTNEISTHLPNGLVRFFEAHPTVRVTLEEHPSTDIVVAVVDGRADLGIVSIDPPHPDLRYLPYREEELVLLVSRDSPLVGLGSVSFRTCLREPFICLQSGTSFHTFLKSTAAALGEQLDVRVQVSSFTALAHLVASGAGVGVVPRTAFDASPVPNVAVLSLDEEWAHRHLKICQRQDRVRSPFVSELIDVLLNTPQIIHAIPEANRADGFHGFDSPFSPQP